MNKKQPPLLLGAHMSITGGLHMAITRGESINCTAIQLFTKSNRQWSAKKITEEEASLFKETAKNSTIKKIVAHASYLINLCSPSNETSNKSINATIQELNRCEQLQIPYLILHPGSSVTEGKEKAIEKIAKNIDLILSNTSGETMLLLETMAGQGTSIGSMFQELSEIKTQLKSQSSIGFCLDTCHIFAAGYDLRSEEAYKNTLDQLEQTIGLNNIHAIHVNDSKKELGSRLDRHENIGEGKIGVEGFRFLLNDKRFEMVPKILETPSGDLASFAHNMETLHQLI